MNAYTADSNSGANTITVEAEDWSPNANTATKSWSVNVTSGAARTFTYDSNGNTLSDGVRTYQWDAQDRLVKITQGTDEYEFIYDGLDRRVAEKINGTITRRWVWDGTEIAEQRAANGTTVQRRYYPQGEQRLSGTDAGSYFYTRDHLGSIRELTDNTAALRARYDFDPYGTREKLSGDLDCDFAFTGHFYHAATSLHLALYRAYDSETARWLSADRFGSTTSRLNALLFETASRRYYSAGLTDPEELPFGPNLYGYLGQNPINFTDPEGEVAPLVVIGIGILGGLALDYAIDKIKNRNLDQPESCPARTGANAGLGAATAATLKTQTKPRTGVAGGGGAGDGTSVASQLNHNLARNGAYSIPTRNLLSKCLRKVPYAGAALGAWQLGDAILNPAESE